MALKVLGGKFDCPNLHILLLVTPLKQHAISYFNMMVFGASEDHVLSTTQFVNSQTCDGCGVACQLPRGHKPVNTRKWRKGTGDIFLFVLFFFQLFLSFWQALAILTCGGPTSARRCQRRRRGRNRTGWGWSGWSGSRPGGWIESWKKRRLLLCSLGLKTWQGGKRRNISTWGQRKRTSRGTVCGQQLHSRKCADALGRVPDVPDFDVSSGNSKNQTGGVPEKITKEGRQNVGVSIFILKKRILVEVLHWTQSWNVKFSFMLD